jgi:hypothetical protein
MIKKKLDMLKRWKKLVNLEPKIFRTSGDTNINRQHFSTFFSDKKIDAAIGVRDSIAVSFMNIAEIMVD